MTADRDPAERASARFQRAAGRRAGRASLWHWWTGELAPLVPRSTRTAVRRRRMRPVLAFDGDTATLWTPVMRGGDIVMEPGTPIQLSVDGSAAAGRAALASLGRAAGSPSTPRLVVAMPGRRTLRRTLTLPAALEENLRQALAYDLDRHTPFKSDELYFDAVVKGRDAARGEIRVDLAAARRNVVDQALQVVDAWGGHVVAVVPDEPALASNSALNLLPDDRRPAAGSLRRWQLIGPLALLAIATIAALALPIASKRDHVIALGRQVDTARGQASVSEGLRTELERLSTEYNFALERKYAYPPTVQVLDEVTKLLPDDTWLTQMELKTTARGKDTQRELMLRGESGNAGRLITLFEESKVFAQAAPRSPTTKIQPGTGEIFDLVAQLRTLPPPAPIAVASAPAEAARAEPAPEGPVREAANPAAPKVEPPPPAAPQKSESPPAPPKAEVAPAPKAEAPPAAPKPVPPAAPRPPVAPADLPSAGAGRPSPYPGPGQPLTMPGR